MLYINTFVFHLLCIVVARRTHHYLAVKISNVNSGLAEGTQWVICGLTVILKFGVLVLNGNYHSLNFYYKFYEKRSFLALRKRKIGLSTGYSEPPVVEVGWSIDGQAE